MRIGIELMQNYGDWYLCKTMEDWYRIYAKLWKIGYRVYAKLCKTKFCVSCVWKQHNKKLGQYVGNMHAKNDCGEVEQD